MSKHALKKGEGESLIEINTLVILYVPVLNGPLSFFVFQVSLSSSLNPPPPLMNRLGQWRSRWSVAPCTGSKRANLMIEFVKSHARSNLSSLFLSSPLFPPLTNFFQN